MRVFSYDGSSVNWKKVNWYRRCTTVICENEWKRCSTASWGASPCESKLHSLKEVKNCCDQLIYISYEVIMITFFHGIIPCSRLFNFKTVTYLFVQLLPFTESKFWYSTSKTIMCISLSFWFISLLHWELWSPTSNSPMLASLEPQKTYPVWG